MGFRRVRRQVVLSTAFAFTADPEGLPSFGHMASTWDSGFTCEEATSSVGLDLWGWLALRIQG